MTAYGSTSGDMGTGIAIAMVLLAGIGGVAMIVGALGDLAAAGFAIAVITGIVAIWALHAYPG